MAEFFVKNSHFVYLVKRVIKLVIGQNFNQKYIAKHLRTSRKSMHIDYPVFSFLPISLSRQMLKCLNGIFEDGLILSSWKRNIDTQV